jgi:uncharacterized protein YecT (DUF1311 family)
MLLAFTAVPREGSTAGDGLCEDAVTQREINICMAAERDKADAKLARIYEEVGAELSDKERDDLEKAQQAWLQYRKLNCAAEAALYEGGTIKPAILLGCEAKLAEERVGELRRIYDASR